MTEKNEVAEYIEQNSYAAEIAAAEAELEAYGYDFEGVGYELLKDKDKLIGVPFFIRNWRFNKSDKYPESDGFASLELVTSDDWNLVINDGSSGIMAQLQEITAKRKAAGHPHPQGRLNVPGGLEKSEYETEDENGKTIHARTYRLAVVANPDKKK